MLMLLNLFRISSNLPSYLNATYMYVFSDEFNPAPAPEETVNPVEVLDIL